VGGKIQKSGELNKANGHLYVHNDCNHSHVEKDLNMISLLTKVVAMTMTRNRMIKMIMALVETVARLRLQRLNNLGGAN